MSKNLTKYDYTVSRKDRIKENKHNSFLIFFTGLSGAGKSTIACALEQKLFSNGIRTYVLDGDNIRRGINSNLGFSPEDRSENNRRVGEISKLFIDAGMVTIAAFVAPYKKDRKYIQDKVGKENYIEVYVGTSLEECEKRDVKGLYKKARTGEIKNMTGISAPYETPTNPDIKIETNEDITNAIDRIIAVITPKLNING
ncbi:adenylyl-sulfate kinase [Flavobacteriaceae bacterium]|nr:adenylyl-sulfate kinase [Flavobacteriaceae bacterium]